MYKNTRLFFITLMLLYSTLFSLNAQTRTEVATGFSNSFHMVANGTDLYIAEYNAGKIVKLDLSVNPATKTDFKTGLANPTGMAVNGNDLYVAEYNSGRVVKINLTSKQQNTVITGVPSGISDGIAFKGNDLYISLATRIVKVPITGTLPIAYNTGTEVVTGLTKIVEIVFKGNELYISDVYGNKIFKKDITTTGTTATEVFSFTFPSALTFDGDYLYTSGFNNQANNQEKVSRINLAATPMVLKDAIREYINIRGLAIVADTLYVLGKDNVSRVLNVSKFPLPCPDKPTVTNNLGVLSTAEVTGATYQWLDCDNSNAPISGATSNTYNPTANGTYAVEVTKGSCKDTSVCTTVSNLGLTESTFVSDVKLYPNPTTKDVTIELGDNYNKLTVEITNLLGQVIASKTIEKVTNRKIVLPINTSKGVYFISIKAKEGFARFKVIKE